MRVKEGFCIVCQSPAVDGFTHALCSAGAKVPTGVFSCFIYDGAVAECIKRAKFGEKEFAVLKKLTVEGARWAKKTGVVYKNLVVVPIPLSNRKLRERGFNQSSIISEVVTKEFSLEIRSDLLARIKDTVSQSKSGKVERQINLAGAFKARSLNSSENRILLVDDVCTTGATILEASKALYEAGAHEVFCFTLSRRP
ncbi:ComF family protein [candidate division WWE3 bacterium]|nr:ComF family protein [candidate division WWE3 bacterium]